MKQDFFGLVIPNRIMNAPSMRAAALAFALSSWVEGLTQFRTALLMSYLPSDGQEDDYNVNPVPPNDAWKDRILSWIIAL